jgi:hypothetical protein
MDAMKVALVLTIVPLLLAACGGVAGADDEEQPLIVPASEEQAAGPGKAEQPGELDAGRDFLAEQEGFHSLIASGDAGPEEVLEALGLPPDFRFRYTTVDGTSMTGMEFRVRGPRSGAPFYEAFASDHPGHSYYVFFERHWFRWRAVDCGFHEAGLISPQFADGG